MIFMNPFDSDEIDQESQWRFIEQDMSHFPDTQQIANQSYVTGHILGDIESD